MRYSLFFLFWWIGLACFAQNKSNYSYQLHHFNVNDGLPSSEVYYALQDSKGYLWLATDAGVVRYKGDQFQTFDQSNGITDNTVFQMYEDIQGRIWFGTFNLKLCYFWKDSIYAYKYNANIEQQTQITRGVNNLYVDTTGSVFLGFDGNGIIEIDHQGHIQKHSPDADSTCSYVSWCQREGGSVYGNSFLHTNDFHIQFDIQLATDTILFRHRFGDELPSSRVMLVPVDNNQFLLFGFEQLKLIYADDNGSYDIKNIKSNFRRSFLYSYLNVGGYNWLSVQNYGVCKSVFRNDSLIILNQLLKEDRVSTIFKDKGNGFWFQSLNDGTYYLPDENIRTIDVSSYVVSLAVDTLNSRLFISTGNRDVYQWNPEQSDKRLFKLNKEPFQNKSYLYYDYDDAALIIHAHKKMKSYQYINDSLKHYKMPFESYFRQIQLIEDTLIGINSFGLALAKGDSLLRDPRITDSFWGKCFFKSEDESILIGTNNGLKKYQNRAVRPFISDTLLQTSITTMVQLGNYHLIGTKENGIIVLSDSVIYDQIDADYGLRSNLIRVLHIDSEGNIWAGTNKGLHYIQYDAATKTKNIRLISTNLGLPSNEITALKDLNGILYVGTKKGVASIQLAEFFENGTAPVILFQQLKINFQPYAIQDTFELAYHQNSIYLKFLALNYRSLGDVNFQYRLIGIDSTWLTTNKNELVFSGLPYGAFKLELRAINEESLISEIQSISFFISKPFWLRWWFIAIGVILFGAFIYVTIKMRERKIVEQAYLETKIVELELKGLRSQMNPYFIFNTLNSIQHAINTQEKQIASDFIAQFGRLIRLVLESSKKSTILLSQEIEILHLYVELESFQFSNKLQFEIIVEENVEDELIAIPSMIIQPFIENAFVCSLKPSDNEHLELLVEFSMLDDSMLNCSIEYNGLTRMESNFVNEASVMENTKNRLEHFSRETNNKFSIEFYDLKDKTGKEVGTRIEIVFVL